MSSIIYTKVDEAPALATYSLLPILRAFGKSAKIEFIEKDISLSGRILSAFCDFKGSNFKQNDDLGELGAKTQDLDANIIKLPNISASIPQLKAAIAELQSQGYKIPNYPEEPRNVNEVDVQNRFKKVLGSAVNPVLREGNSDRRAPKAVKNYAKNNPHKMGEWSKGSQTNVIHMNDGDFYGNEKSYIASKDTYISIEFIGKDFSKVLKSNLKIVKNEIIDSSFLSIKRLRETTKKAIKVAKNNDILFSTHLKATMMKISDPVIFGTILEVYFQELFEKYFDIFNSLGVNPNNGLGDLYTKIETLPKEKKERIKADIKSIIEQKAKLAMVDSENEITNFHVPSDVIVDASMPAMIRNSGKMWDKDGKTSDTIALIPDRCYAGVYQAVIEDCKKNGALDPKTMGSVSNVGLMAQKAEEYGSHDKTFVMSEDGAIVVKDENDCIIFEDFLEKGDIWRMCQTKDSAILDWIKLAVNRAKESKLQTIFWLDENRAHDLNVIKKVKETLKSYDSSNLNMSILNPIEATKLSLQKIRKGEDVISVTGNVLRDYLTDLFPILELGTSAKMLSIVPLMNGGGLFETGAGGSAPKLAKQLHEENHLRWDSLGEFLAITASFEHLAKITNNKKVLVLAKTLDNAIEKLLDEKKSPLSKVGQLDNRGSHFYLSLFWAQSLSKQNDDKYLSEFFTPIADKLLQNEIVIVNELNTIQGNIPDVGGYYHLDDKKAEQVMRPSKVFNKIIDEI